jgi:hypothetical protein
MGLIDASDFGPWIKHMIADHHLLQHDLKRPELPQLATEIDDWKRDFVSTLCTNEVFPPSCSTVTLT